MTKEQVLEAARKEYLKKYDAGPFLARRINFNDIVYQVNLENLHNGK